MILRALAAADLAMFVNLYSNAETMRFIGRPLSQEQAAASFRDTLRTNRKPCGSRFFAIAEKRGGRAVGLCAIQPEVDERRAQAGLMLVRSACRRGYASEALGMLIGVAFRSLPIDAVWAQYRRGNTSAARLCNALDFSETDGWRPSGAGSGFCVRIMQRPAWRMQPNQPEGGVPMSNTIGSNLIGFLENVGRDAALRHASREQLLHAMRREGVAPSLLASAIDPTTGGARDTLYCLLLPVKPPKKAPKKAPPAKAPPKKSPAKKPAKKAPAKKSSSKRSTDSVRH